MTTKVIFKKFKDEDIIVCFPELAGDMSQYTCLSYQHLGQHGSADVWSMSLLQTAIPTEYQDLLQELISIGYDDLVIRKKFLYRYQLKRMEQIK